MRYVRRRQAMSIANHRERSRAQEEAHPKSFQGKRASPILPSWPTTSSSRDCSACSSSSYGPHQEILRQASPTHPYFSALHREREKKMIDKANKVAIVTGGSRGIGAVVAERLPRDGFAVIVNYSANAAHAETLVRQIEARGGRALAARADVSDPDAMRGMFDAAERALGGIDVLVNNAGIMKLAMVADSDDESLDQQIAVNLKGSFYGMREAARRLRDGGRIVNFSTSVVGTKLETYSIYAATKAAVEMMNAILAKKLRGRNITVNAVAPGPVATELFLTGKSAELIARMAKMSPRERLGTPEDIASVVSFLVGPDGGWISGQVLRSVGGLV